jgi:hypothetical protein
MDAMTEQLERGEEIAMSKRRGVRREIAHERKIWCSFLKMGERT